MDDIYGGASYDTGLYDGGASFDTGIYSGGASYETIDAGPTDGQEILDNDPVLFQI